MTRSMVVTAVFALAACAQATDRKTDSASQTPAAPAKTTASKPAPSIPKDAVKNPDGTYSYTDKQGQKWVYVNTPFGVMRSAAPETDSQIASPRLTAGTKLIDKGDTVRFEQPGPFGAISWEKKKTELTDQERQMLDAQNQTAKPDAK